MNLSDDKSGLLQTFLGSLPEAAASKLAHAVEMDRLADGRALPHDMILTGLRAALRPGKPPRTKTPLRLFCQPFEDLLVSGPRKAKQKAVIARTSLSPVWHWLNHDLLPDDARAYAKDVKALALAGQDAQADARAAEFGRQAGPLIRAALKDGKGARKLTPDQIADADEMALLISEAAEIARIQERLPKGLPHLTEDILWQLRECYEALIARAPDAAPFVAVVTMNRLQRPWEALRLPLAICRQTGDALLSKTDMGLVGEIIFARMDALQAAIMSTRHPLFEAETLLSQVSGFADLSSAIVKEIEVRRDGEWGQRLLQDRKVIGNAMDGFMDRAIKEVSAALPMQKGAGDFTRPAPAEKRALGLNYAKLVVGSRNFAAAACFAAKQKTALEDLCNHLRRYIDDAVRELRACDGERRAGIESQMQYCAELAAILFSEEEAELIRRRARAAMSAAA